MRAPLALLILLVACTEEVETRAPDDAGSMDVGPVRDADVVDGRTLDARSFDADPSDLAVADSGPDAAQIDAGSGDAEPLDAGTPGADAGGAFDSGPTPTLTLEPIAGELTIIQLDLPGGVTLRLGEAAIIVGPAGSIALLDVGNSNHDDEVRARLAEVNQGLGRPVGQVEWIILTHFHGDHIGAMEGLFTGASPLTVTRGVVYRGFVDLGDGMNVQDYGQLCDLLTGTLANRAKPMCASPSAAPCAWASGDDPFVADRCPGLTLGDLMDPVDDSLAEPSYVDLDGVRITINAADAWVHDGNTAQAMAPFGHTDSNEENGRSLVGQIAFGDFRYHFGGDLTGSGDPGEPDVESYWVGRASTAFYDTLGADVIHAHHHARRTSSNATFVTAMAPIDGRARNVVAGINAVHVGSPYTEVLDAWTQGNRLGSGGFWVTEVATGGASPAAYPSMVVADGELILQTFAAGDGYWLQASGPSINTRAYPSLR